jgi:hypothetical protein
VRKYTLNENFFENIDSERKTYWLGFITADGCLSVGPSKTRLTIGLKGQDGNHLEKFASDIQYSGPVVVSSPPSLHGWKRAFISVTSKKFVEGLLSQGITPRKSLTALPWHGPDELMSHYWRGIIDGDGSLSSGYGRDGKAWNLRIAGTKAIVQAFLDFARPICGTNATPRPHGNIWVAAICGQHSAPKMIEKLYGDAIIALERKQLIAKQCFSKPMAQEGGAHVQ